MSSSKNCFLFILLFFFFIFSSCTKEDLLVIPDNQPPPDKTISKEIMLNYVSKSYISILGRDPSIVESNSAVTVFQSSDFSKDSREDFLSQLLNTVEFRVNNYKIARAELLNNLDTADISQEIYVLELLLTQPQYALFYDLLTYEKNRLVELKALYSEVINGTITLENMWRKCVNNKFYDDINMGSENFVVSNFQYFLLRYPTDTELAEGKKMVDGFQGVVLLQLGYNKQDFIDIVFNSTDFLEGRVRYLFRKHLFREPATEEMVEYTLLYQQSGSYALLLKNILLTDEFSGLK